MTSNVAKKKSILIVDDDVTLREAIVFDFKRRGYNVFSAPDGVEAFKIVQKEKIDVVVSDIRMPNGDGVELLDNVKEFNIRIPVLIFITGFSDLTLEDAYNKGACAIMSKPFDRKILLETVRRSLEDYQTKFANPMSVDNCDVNVDMKFQNSSEQIQAKLISIGHGGMFLSTQRIQGQVNQSIFFKIEQVNSNLPMLQGQGIIRWVRTDSESGDMGFGIEFVFLHDDCRRNVIEFLERLQIKAFIPKAA